MFCLSINIMQRYILLGSNNPNPSKENLKAISSSEDPKQLMDIWNTISKFYHKTREVYQGDLFQRAIEMIEKHPYLDKLFDVQLESIIWNVEVIGVFQAVRTGAIELDFFD